MLCNASIKVLSSAQLRICLKIVYNSTANLNKKISLIDWPRLVQS